MAYICNGCSQSGVIPSPCVTFTFPGASLPFCCLYDGDECDWQKIPDDKAIKIINGETNQGEEE